MEKYTCPACGRSTYSADTEAAHHCLQCAVERILIVSPRAFDAGLTLADFTVIIDRRETIQAVADERRSPGTRPMMPVAWMVMRRRHPQAEA